MANSVSAKVKDGLEEGEIEDDVVEDSRKGMSISRSHGRVSSNSSKRPVAESNQRQQLRIPWPNAKGVEGGGSGSGGGKNGGDGWERTKELLKNALNQGSENTGRSPRAKPTNSNNVRHRERSNSKTASTSSYKVPQDLRDKMPFSTRRGSSSYSTPPVRPVARDTSTNKLARYPWYRTKRYPSRTPARPVRINTPRPMPRPINTSTSFSGGRPSASSSSSNNNNASNKCSLDVKKKASHDDCSYEDLLLQYKSIQSQLEDLKREEAKSDHSFRVHVEDNLDKENVKGESRRRSWKDDARFGKLDRFSLGAEALKTRRRRNRSRFRTLPSEPRPSNTASAATTAKTQDEDDEVELRRIALASKLTRKRRLSVRNSQNSDSATVPLNLDTDGDVMMLENSGGEGVPVVQGCDNYEEVAMELDSNCGEDLVGDLGDELEDEDEDEVALRNHLLLSLNMKKKTKNLEVPQPLVNEDNATVNDDVVSDNKEVANGNEDINGHECTEEVTNEDEAIQQIVKMSAMAEFKDKETTDFASAAKNLVVATSVGAPIHKRVVINLAEDSSDSESDDNSSPLLSTIDQFLKEARRTAETKQAVLRLSGAQVQEYCRLKEEIAKREQVVPKPEPKMGQELVACQASDDTSAYNKQLGLNEKGHTPKESIRAEEFPSPKPQNIHPTEGKLMEISENANDEQELRILRAALVKKKALLTASEQQVKRFQEQLAAAQKVVAVHRSTVQKLSSQIALVRQRLTVKSETDLKLKPSSTSAQIRNVTVQKRIKQSLNIRVTPKKQRIVRLKKEISTFTPQQLADEKRRLKQLEQETLLRLQALRQTRGLQTAASKPTLDAKELIAGTGSPVKKKILLEKDVAPKSPTVSVVKADTNTSVNTVAVENKTQNACRLVESDEYTAITSSPFLSDSPVGEMSWEKQVNCNEIVPFDFCNMLNPLTHLRSYRASKQSDCSANSLTFAHKIDPNWTFCSFDLLGTCNDDQCPWQHLPRTK